MRVNQRSRLFNLSTLLAVRLMMVLVIQSRGVDGW